MSDQLQLQPTEPMSTNTKRGIEPRPHESGPTSDHLMAQLTTWPKRFREKFTITEGCWVWTACRDDDGYGRFGMGRKDKPRVQRAHRYAFKLAYPDVDIEGLSLDHLCRNPSCVRPDHLEPVTHRENVLRGASSNVSGRCRAGLHPWVPENIVHEPARKGQPYGVRRCRSCRDKREHRRLRSRGPQGGRGSDDA